MGTYNTQYRDYYDNMRRKNYASYRYGNSNNASNNISGNSYLSKRFLIDLVGVLILFLLVIGCKTLVNPKTQAVYAYFKDTVNRNYDYKQNLEKVKNFNYKGFQDKAVNFIDEVKAKLTLNKNIEGKVEDKFVVPENNN